MRFLLSRRWLAFALAVAALAYGAFWLGEWQFHRLEDREARNAVTERNLGAPPVPVAEVLAVDRPTAAADEWRRVRATGRYVDDETVVVRYQTRDGESGVDAVTPLLTATGTAVLVDRGWLRTENTGGATADVPAAPPGKVTVVGWVRLDATGDEAQVHDGSTRAVSSAAIAPRLPFPVYSGFLDALTETPPPDRPLVKAERPDLGNGPHFFYGVQWWFFAALAIFGFGYLVRDEVRKKRRPAAKTATGAVAQDVKS